MLKNFIKVGLRHLLRNKSYVIINMLGLGIALACCVTAYLLVAYNLEFDQTFSDEEVEDIFMVHTRVTFSDGNTGQHMVTPLNLGPDMYNDLSGIKNYTRFGFDGGFVRYGDDAFNEGIALADASFFDLFEFDIVEGSLTSFQDLGKIVISESMAEKYFDDSSAIGKILTLHFANNHEEKLEVGAVVKELPLNSSLVFDIMMRIEHFQDTYDLTSSEWGDWRDVALYLELEHPDNATSIASQLQPYVELRNEMREDLQVQSFQLEPFKAPFTQDDVAWHVTNARMSVFPLVIFSVMALLILLVACFNLANTSFAMAARRLKEVGVRKVIGASRLQIISQFIFEMVLTILLALIAGMAVSNVIVREFTDMWGLTYGLEDLNGLNLMITVIVLVFVAAVVAGLYPALANSGYQPVTLLKGKVRVKGTNFFTRTLVGLQFAISVVVLVNGIAIVQNAEYQEQVDHGFDMDDVLSVNIMASAEYDVIKNRLTGHPLVSNSAITHHGLGFSSYPFPVTIDTTDYAVQNIEVGEDFFEVMGLKLKSGRFLDMDLTSDQTAAMVVNEAFVKEAGLQNPIDQAITVRGERKRIVGVVENHVDNLFRSRDPEPFVFYGSKPNEYQMMLVKSTSATVLPQLQDEIEAIWKEEFENRPFMSRFQEDMTMGSIRRTNTNLKKIFIFLTILGGLLSAAGIFALASLNVERRTKEIGIRKALGASIQHMIALLSREFSIILGIAALLGGVGGYFIADTMLEEIYAYRLPIGIIPVMMGGLTLVIVGLMTTGSTIFHAARANPVKSLRDE
ncbi:MAG: ABC transporter permease [Bacteroidota bacterium]